LRGLIIDANKKIKQDKNKEQDKDINDGGNDEILDKDSKENLKK